MTFHRKLRFNTTIKFTLSYRKRSKAHLFRSQFDQFCFYSARSIVSVAVIMFAHLRIPHPSYLIHKVKSLWGTPNPLGSSRLWWWTVSGRRSLRHCWAIGLSLRKTRRRRWRSRLHATACRSSRHWCPVVGRCYLRGLVALTCSDGRNPRSPLPWLDSIPGWPDLVNMASKECSLDVHCVVQFPITVNHTAELPS